MIVGVLPTGCDSQRKFLEEHRFSGYCGADNSHQMKHHGGVINPIMGFCRHWETEGILLVTRDCGSVDQQG